MTDSGSHDGRPPDGGVPQLPPEELDTQRNDQLVGNADTHDNPAIISNTNPERSSWIKDHTRPFVATIAGVAVASSAAAYGYFHKSSNHDATNKSPRIRPIPLVPAERPSMTNISSQLASVSPEISEVTDAQLSGGGFNCGHTQPETATGNVSFGPQVDFYTKNPETAKAVIDFQINNSTWGMGQSAWDVLKNQGIKNPATPDTSRVAPQADNGSGDGNAYLHLLRTEQLDAARNYLNFTCEKNGNPSAVQLAGLISIKERSHVNGVLLDADGKQAFENVVRKFPDGSDMVDIIDLGMRDVPDANGNTISKHVFLIVLEAEGCENPQRKIPPKVIVSAPPNSTSTTMTSLPPAVIIVPSPKPPKTDPGTLPGPRTTKPTTSTTFARPAGQPGGSPTTSTTKPKPPPPTKPTIPAPTTTSSPVGPPTSQPAIPPG